MKAGRNDRRTMAVISSGSKECIPVKAFEKPLTEQIGCEYNLV